MIRAMLSAANRAALAHVRAQGTPTATPPDAPITLNFHPDRRLADGREVVDRLLEEGVYRNQFETGISNGLLGGDRLAWERELFGGAYDRAPPVERPKYGALNVTNDELGAAPTFGSCHLRLRPHVLERATFVQGDSHRNRTGARVRATFDLAGDSIEAHVHGPVELATDAEALVIDPCYRDGRLEALAERYGLALERHRPLRLPLDRVPAEPPGDEWEWQRFCAGGQLRRLAQRVGVPLDAAKIGAADLPVQQRKYLWWVVVLYAP
jgi:hypothetical protein